MKTKLCVLEKPSCPSDLLLLALWRGESNRSQTLFTDKLPDGFNLQSLELVKEPRESDYCLYAYAIKDRRGLKDPFLSHALETAQEAGKKLVVFIGGDLSHRLFLPEAIVLKGSQYAYLKADNEIIVPPFAEDLGQSEGLSFRTKGEKPVVGFCGWADFPDFSARLKAGIKDLIWRLAVFLRRDPQRLAERKGLYFRRAAIRRLKHSPLVKTNFIIRRSFSASKKTISLAPEVARQEYIQNLKEADLVLAPKGDGNFSVRFYEALSLGRVPLLVDTATVLPLAQEINYDEFILRVPCQEEAKIAEQCARFYQSLSPDQFLAKQKLARQAFEKYLRYDSFFNHLFSLPLEKRLSR